jgi:hypothetical protein
MGSSISNKLLPQVIGTIDSATFTGAYQLVLTLTHPASFLRIVNGSNTNVAVSFDGTHDHEFVPTVTQFNLPVGSLNQAGNYNCFIPSGTSIYVKAPANMANAGIVSVSAYYQPYNP